MHDPAAAWFQKRRYLLFLAFLSAVPLLWPHLPPIVDLDGHLGRYAVELAAPDSPLHRYYEFKWALIGNLGIDLLIVPMAKLFGLETAAKLIILCIPPLTVAGWLWTAREVHGRIPATAAFALPLAYGYPFAFGFINFVLSMALCFNAFALWLRLGRLGRTRVRQWLFVPTAMLIWLCHIYGWAVLCLLVLAAEIVRARRRAATWPATIWAAGWGMLPLAPPFLLMILWRSGAVAGHTFDFFDWRMKWSWTLAVLRDWSLPFDLASLGLIYLVLLLALVRLGLRYSVLLGLGALFLLAAYLCLPRILIGSAYADMRLFPFLLAAAVLAVRPKGMSPRGQTAVALVGLAFFAARMGVTAAHYAALDRAHRAQLAATAHIARGSRVLVQVALPCQGGWRGGRWVGGPWAYSRMDHLGALAIGRTQSFVNGQWTMPGAQLLSMKEFGGGRFTGDPTQLLRPPHCRRYREARLDDTLAHFPRAAFDYLWMIDLPLRDAPREPDLVPIWTGPGRGILYRVAASATSASDTPKGSAPRVIQ